MEIKEILIKVEHKKINIMLETETSEDIKEEIKALDIKDNGYYIYNVDTKKLKDINKPEFTKRNSKIYNEFYDYCFKK